MMTLTNIYARVVAAGLLALALVGCQKTETAAEDAASQKGPAEKVGEHIDKAAGEAAKHLSTMAEHAGKGIEKAGESLQKQSKDTPEKDVQPQQPQEKQ
jgi:hypothetical protein